MPLLAFKNFVITESIIARLLSVMCLAVLGGILVAGLQPFQSPKNQVTWTASENGLRFAEPGTIVSAGEFKADGPAEMPCSIELWIQPALPRDSNTLLAFHNGKYPRQLELRQSVTDLRVTRDSPLGRWDFYVDNAFSPLRPLFITINSGAPGTAVYLNGVLVRTVGGFRISASDCTGRLVIATSPTGNQPWTGRLRGLAIYNRQLTGSQVLTHYQTWVQSGHPEMTEQERCAALYLFDEHGGAIAHNRVGPSPSLLIPEKYRIEDQTFLMAFWKEFNPLDIIENVVAFIPLGFLFCAYLSLKRCTKRPALTATILGALISTIMEVIQSRLPTRQSDSTDIITDTLGTWLGAMLCAYALGFLAERSFWPLNRGC